MTITATILQDDPQPGTDKRNALIQFDDDVDGSSFSRLFSRPISEDLQAWADGYAASLEIQRGQQELETNFETVRQGQNATTLVWVRNTVDVGDEYICKGASNMSDATAVANFAHIHREYSNPRIVAVTGLSNPQRQAWSGHAQSLESALIQYQDEHTADPAFFFDGFPTE